MAWFNKWYNKWFNRFYNKSDVTPVVITYESAWYNKWYNKWFGRWYGKRITSVFVNVTVKYWTGTEWSSACKVKIFNGNKFIEKPLKVWNGIRWVLNI